MCHELLAYADDLVFFAKNQLEAREIINKLSRLSPFLEINRKKSAIMEIGSK